MRSVPQATLVFVGIASFVAGTFFRLKPISEETVQGWNANIKKLSSTNSTSTPSLTSTPPPPPPPVEVTTTTTTLSTDVTPPQTTPSTPTTTTTTTTNDPNAGSQQQQNNCQLKLDNLDHVWDMRRDARRKATKDRTTPYKPPGVHWQSNGFFDFFEQEAVCFDDERFGSKSVERYMSFGDGPKFVCGVDRIVEKAKTNKDCLIYSVGSNNEIDFEVAITNIMGQGNCEVHTFDPTVRPETYVGNDYSQFHDWGFGVEGHQTVINHRRGRFNFTEMSLATAMKKLGHYGTRKIDIFKIDCEGCEYVALTAAFQAMARGEIKVDQVQVEVHGGNAIGNFPRLKAMFEAADAAGMRVFHKEPNGWGCQGYLCIEYAFVSNEFLRTANAHYVC